MQDLIVILVGSILVNNFVLVEFLGLSTLVTSLEKTESVVGLAVATTMIMTLTTIANFAVHTLLLEPFDLIYLSTFAFIVTIGVVTLLTREVSRTLSPFLTSGLELFTPLIYANSAVLGVSLLTMSMDLSLLQSVWLSFGTGVGFSLVLVSFTLMREKIDMADVPKPFQGTAIGIITAGLMSLGFMGLIGLN
jgi:electron transport complex protein RnfA